MGSKEHELGTAGTNAGYVVLLSARFVGGCAVNATTQESPVLLVGTQINK